MGVNLCTCKDYNKLFFQQKSDYVFQNINNNYIVNSQKVSEMKTTQKEGQTVKSVNSNKDINDNDKNKNLNNSVSNNESANENDEENINNDDQNYKVKIDIVEEMPEEEERSKGKSIRNEKSAMVVKKDSDSFRRRSMEFMEQDFEQKIKKYGDYVDEIFMETVTKQQIKDIEKSLGEFSQEKTNENPDIFTRDAIFFRSNKILYKGDWNKSGIKEGFGICIDSIGNKYIGFWKNNVFNGKGRLISVNGDYYEGDFYDGSIQGQGKFYNKKEKYTYIGKFVNNKFEGEGEIKYENNDELNVNYYKGFFKNGLREGEGKLEFNDGKFYQGEFKNNFYDGNGTFDFKDGSIYKGHWEKNCIDGSGEFIWGNGDKYKGGYKNFEKDGYGDYYSDNNYYKGNWLMGFPHGKGKVRYDGNTVGGIFRFGKMIKTVGVNLNLLNTMNTDTKTNDDNEDDKNVKKKKSRKGKRGKSYKESGQKKNKDKDKKKKSGSFDKK